MAKRSVQTLVLGLALAGVALPGLAAGADPAPAPGRGAEHRYTNQLVHSANPYLLLHAHNPVDWYPWGPEAFERAKKEDKPIFLSVGYSTCYWCHVAERVLYSDPAIAALMNQWFVNVKVDREERPDVDRIYMLATQLMTGRGGWPNNVFLTPDMKPIFAGSYFSPADDPSGRPGFPTLIKAIHERWTADRKRVTDQAVRVFLAMLQAQRPDISRAPGAVNPAEWLAHARDALARGVDPNDGGFFRGNGPKFPHEPMLDLLLTDYRVNRTADSLSMLRKALDAMAYGGIRDHLAGGFHRYSTEPTWSVPHFEKMLYNNAQLLRLYAEAYQITQDPLYKAVALELSDYLNREMSAPEGGLFTAQDAEVNGEEGASYAWARPEIISILGAQDAQRFFQVYELTLMARPGGQAGMGDPVGVLRVRGDVAKGGNAAALTSLNALAPLRARLLDARNRRPQPLRDDKIVVGLNGLAIEALVRSAKILGRPRDLAAARRSADRIWAVAYDPGARRLKHQIFGGRAQTDAFLEDYAVFGNGLMALYDTTREALWRSRAVALADDLLRQFARPDGGLSTTPNEKDLLLPPQDDGDGVYPSGTSAAVALLLRLGASTGDPRYAAAAARIVASLDAELQKSPWGWSALVATVNSQTPEQQRVIASAGPAARVGGLASTLPLPNTADHVRITTSAASKADHDEIVATLHVDEGWHVNANPASLDFLIPTTMTFAGPPPSGLAYPASVRITPKFAPDGLDVYEGQARVVATFPRGTLARSRDIRATIRTQACSNEVCLPEATFDVIVPQALTPR